MKNLLLGLSRIALGWIFFWAFIDKTFGLGFATTVDKAWINGGSPTMGFLSNATKGPFAEFFKSMAGSPWVDWAFMLGLLLIGTALILGIASRLATLGGFLMMLFMYLASAIWPANNPFVDDHVIYGLLILLLFTLEASDYYGFGRAWKNSRLVNKLPFLK